jgi:predicted DNA-binding transcriptional regulator YafY
MKNKNALARYRLIDNRMTMKQKPAPTLQNLVEYVSEKMNMSISTASIQKDLYAMRYHEELGFNAPIEYSKEKRGYIYTDPDYSINHIPVSEDDLHGLEMAIGILEQFKDIPAIRLFEDAITKIASSVKQSREKANQGKIVLLDRPKRYQGIEYMSDIVEAIQGRNVLRIQYQAFNRTEARKHTVHPYFIKEYNGRMYLIGKAMHPTKESKFLTFAFDRIADLTKMNQTFVEEAVDQENYFRETIGISMPGTQPEKIVLRFAPEQANYLKSQPIHHSQQIIRESKKEFTISIQVVINYELRALLLGFGNQVKVMKPAYLAKEFKEIAAAMLDSYRD